MLLCFACSKTASRKQGYTTAKGKQTFSHQHITWAQRLFLSSCFESLYLTTFLLSRKRENYFARSKKPEQAEFKLPFLLNVWKGLKNFTSQGSIFHLVVLQCLYCLTCNALSPVSDSRPRRKNRTRLNIYKRTLISLLQKVLQAKLHKHRHSCYGKIMKLPPQNVQSHTIGFQNTGSICSCLSTLLDTLGNHTISTLFYKHGGWKLWLVCMVEILGW